MTQHTLFQMFLILVLLITFLSGRALYYDELDEQDRSQLSTSNEDEGKRQIFDTHKLLSIISRFV